MAKNRARYEEAIKRGEAYLQNDQWQEAFGVYRVAIAEFSQSAPAYDGLGQACFGLKQLDRALECYKLAARYSKGDVKYLQKVADMQERLGRLGEAARTYMAVGEVLLRQRELDKAVNNWQRAIRLESSLLGPHRRLAMVYQRQNNIRDAVREYLAIARILQMQGEDKKALQMCRAALRLDPDSPDVITAIDLIRKGAAEYNREEEEEEEEEVEETAAVQTADEDLPSMVRQMARAFEADRAPVVTSTKTASALDDARALAQNQLAEEIFRDEDDDDAGSLSKLERDALIGQAMDYESRNQMENAIGCYERAIVGGLKLPAAYFSLGLLYKNNNQSDKASRALQMAAKDPAYQAGAQEALR